ncbi:MAG: type II toxin-antitoxin system VapC family toxin [Cyanobacteria bacterium J06634_6]
MRQIILDAGPLIGFFSDQDTYHEQCVTGFQQLAQAKVSRLVPLPIVFEVYKWVLQRSYPQAAWKALQVMEQNCQILEVNSQDFKELKAIITKLPKWTGSLEDGTVMLTAVQHSCPIWTYNFRDFSSFQALEFWNPNLKD